VKASGNDYDTVWKPETDITWREKNPTFTYADGVLTQIGYTGGNTKTFTYSGGVLTRIDYLRGATTIRKDFGYTGGNLTSITQTEF
jgi:hypothetical protein